MCGGCQLLRRGKNRAASIRRKSRWHCSPELFWHRRTKTLGFSTHSQVLRRQALLPILSADAISESKKKSNLRKSARNAARKSIISKPIATIAEKSKTLSNLRFLNRIVSPARTNRLRICRFEKTSLTQMSSLRETAKFSFIFFGISP